MQKETISSKQAICMITLFIFGSSVIMGVSTEVKQDSWIALIFSIIMVMPIMLVYARITKLFPERDVYDIVIKLFGNIFGKIVILIFTFYAVHLGALVLRNFSEFFKIVMLLDTPEISIMVFMILVTIYLAKNGIEVLGNWSLIALPLIALMVILTALFSLNIMQPSNLLPVFEHSIGEIAAGAYTVFTFPFAETVLFITLFSSVKKGDSPYKIYFTGAMIGAVLCLLVVLRNIMVLGSEMINTNYFPSYSAARIIRVGEFLARMEGIISVNLMLGGITKITVCILSGAKGLTKLVGLPDHKKMIIPSGLVILALCSILYKNAMEMFEFIKLYQFYAIPFQLILPLIIWITAEIKTRRGKRQLFPEPTPNTDAIIQEEAEGKV